MNSFKTEINAMKEKYRPRELQWETWLGRGGCQAILEVWRMGRTLGQQGGGQELLRAEGTRVGRRAAGGPTGAKGRECIVRGRGGQASARRGGRGRRTLRQRRVTVTTTTDTRVSCSNSGNLEESFKTFSNDCCFPVRRLWELAN